MPRFHCAHCDRSFESDEARCPTCSREIEASEDAPAKKKKKHAKKKARPASTGVALLWIGATALLIWIGKYVEIPGVDTTVLQEMGELSFGSPFAVIGLAMWALVALRLGLALFGRSSSGPARSIAFGIYLSLVVVQGLAIAFWAESLENMPFTSLVLEPGWKFRLMAVLTWATGASVLWWLADRVDATKRATGALTVALFSSLFEMARAAFARGTSWASGESGPLAALLPLLLPLALVVAAVLVIWYVPKWPVRVARALELRSAFDALAAPAAAAILVGATVEAPTLRTLGLEHVFQVLPVDAFGPVGSIASVGAFVVAIALAVLFRARESGGVRSFLPLWGALAVVAIALSAQGASFLSAGGLQRALEPGPLEGDASYRVTLEAAEGTRFGPHDAEAMVARAESLGAQAEIVSTNARRITLRFSNAAPPGRVLDALRPHHLALQLVAPSPEIPDLPAGIVRSPDFPDGPQYEGPCEAMHAWARTLPPAQCRAAVEPYEVWRHDDVPRCTLLCLEDERVITERDIASSNVGTDPQIARPLVLFELRPDSAARFERFTRANLRRRIAIVVDGEVMSSPVIMGPIGAHGQITLGRMRDYQEALTEASTLAIALSPEGHLSVRDWVLADQSAP